MNRPLVSLGRVVAAAGAVALLTTGCGTVAKVSSCAQLVNEGAEISALVAAGDVQSLVSKSGGYAKTLRDEAAKTSDPELKTAMTTLAEDLEAVDKISTSKSANVEDSQAVQKIPADVQALRQACTNLG